MQNKVYYSWFDLKRDCYRLTTDIIESGFKPEALVVVTRGGLAIASILSYYLDIKKIDTYCIHSYTEEDKRSEIDVIKQAGYRDLKALIVDDVVDSGATVLRVKADYPRGKTAVIHYKPGIKIKPDYFVERERGWIVYPWEVEPRSAE